jgi:benzoyl-CoA reductase/2-hydroxyglutaryl-CoA dehydratase subunit BcrC/BadD/HgdB
MDQLREIVRLSRECTDLWKAVLDTGAAMPSPINFFDATIHMGPAVVARGTTEAVNYYKILLRELKERIGNDVAAVEGEKHRLYWDGMPIWGRLRNLSDLFSGLKSCVVASTYCNSWIFTAFDPAEPFKSMARAYIELFIVRDEFYKEEYIKKCLDFFKVNGLIFHDAKTCPNNSNNRYGMPGRLEKKVGIPALTINGDLNDLRCYSEEQVTTSIEAFIEQLDERL